MGHKCEFVRSPSEIEPTARGAIGHRDRIPSGHRFPRIHDRSSEPDPGGSTGGWISWTRPVRPAQAPRNDAGRRGQHEQPSERKRRRHRGRTHTGLRCEGRSGRSHRSACRAAGCAPHRSLRRLEKRGTGNPSASQSQDDRGRRSRRTRCRPRGRSHRLTARSRIPRRRASRRRSRSREDAGVPGRRRLESRETVVAERLARRVSTSYVPY